MSLLDPTLTDYQRVQVVSSFEELVATPFAHGVNALCWSRVLVGDFAEVAEHFRGSESIRNVDDAELQVLSLSPPARVAVQLLLEDLRLLRAHGREPALNYIHNYPRDESGGPVPTDVFSFHADSAPVEADTWLCTYYGAPSEGLRNEQAQRRIDVPATRAALLQEFAGEDDAAFREYLNEQCYDLHYAPLPGARPFSFGIGNLWRLAVDWPGSPVPPCIHRAPETLSTDSPRLLLIS